MTSLTSLPFSRDPTRPKALLLSYENADLEDSDRRPEKLRQEKENNHFSQRVRRELLQDILFILFTISQSTISRPARSALRDGFVSHFANRKVQIFISQSTDFISQNADFHLISRSTDFYFAKDRFSFCKNSFSFRKVRTDFMSFRFARQHRRSSALTKIHLFAKDEKILRTFNVGVL